MDDIYYPSIENKDFNKLIQSHPEFLNYKYERDTYVLDKMKKQSLEKCNSSGGYIFKKIQMFVSTFLSINTPYNGLLLYHGVGVGKTCSSILISNSFRDYVKKNNKKIIILTKKTVQDSFKKEIFNFNLQKNKLDKNSFSCISDEFNSLYNNFMDKTEDSTDIKKIKEFTMGIIDDYYEIYGYIEFFNKYNNLIKVENEYNKKKINEYFSNCIFIIDEIHNLRDEVNEEDNEEDDDEKKQKKKLKPKKDDSKKSRIIIQNIIQHLNNPIKLILLSATPMYDKYDEFEFIINLLLLNDKKPLLPKIILDKYILNNNKEAYEEIVNKTKGYISYIKGNDPHIFPLVLFPLNNSNLEFKTETSLISSKKINAVLCSMNQYQKDIYKNDKNSNTQLKKYSNVVFPNNVTFEDLFEENKNMYSFKNSELCNEFLENIQNYSIKIYNLIQNLNNSIGKVFIYSEYIKGNYAGNNLLAIVLEYYGYVRKIVSKNNIIVQNICNDIKSKVKGYYVVVDGSTKEEVFTFYKEQYNLSNNINGNMIKIIIGTTNMIEGVSLNNVRQIHIMQPWYNISRNEQIVGRGVRQCSHINLDFNLRNVTIFNYVAISEQLEFNDKSQCFIVPYFKNTRLMDIDLRKLQLATEKITKIEIIEDIFQKNSVDCNLNENINNIEIQEVPVESNIMDESQIITYNDSFNNTRLISYTYNNEKSCMYKTIDLDSNEIYNIQYKTFTNKNLKKNIQFFIKTIFKKGILRKIDSNNIINIYQTNKIYFSYDELFEELMLYDSQITEDLFKISIQDLILNKEILYNKFNKSGYIIVKSIYFIFKPNQFEDVLLPLEFSEFPFNNKIDSIENYKEFSIYSSSSESTTKTTTVKKTSTSTSTVKSKTGTPEVKKTATLLSSNQQIVTELLEHCEEIGLFESLQNPSIYSKYDNLWKIKLNPVTAKKLFGLIDFNTTNIKDLSESELYITIFNILFKTKKNNSFLIDNEILDIFYNNYHSIHFIFNYSILIITYLKCLFYRFYILKKPLLENEKKIYDHYKSLIVSEDPLVFKYIDFYKNELDIYSYENIGLIYYEFKDGEYITHNTKYNNFTFKHNNFDLYRIFPLMIQKSYSPYLTNKDFITKQLNIDSFDFDRIYDSFKLNEYYDYNNCYFKYSGDPSNPFSKSTVKTKKLSNVIGIILVQGSNSKNNLNDLSRNIFTLGTIYSIHKNNKNYYLKASPNTGYTNIEVPKTKGAKVGVQKLRHLNYCILDQIEELNYKIILEIILQKDDVNTLWNDEDSLFKYKFKDILININLKNIELSNENYNELTNLFEDFSLVIDNITVINTNLKKNSFKLYIHYQSIYNILNHELSESRLITLATYILYSLDTFYHNESYRSFYNKRWLLSLLESSLLNAKVLNIDLISTSQLENADSSRIADSASFTKNTFILSKTFSKKEISEYLDSDK